MKKIVLTDAGNPARVRDTVIYDGNSVRYETGEARPIIESRRRLYADREQIIDSLDGWSNGAVSTTVQVEPTVKSRVNAPR